MARLACHLNDIHRGTAFFFLPACFFYGWQASQPGFCVHLCRLLLYSILENVTIGFQPFCVRILETSTFGFRRVSNDLLRIWYMRPPILENMTIGFQPFCVRILETSIFGFRVSNDMPRIWFTLPPILENMTIGFQPFCVRILETSIFGFRRVSNDMRHFGSCQEPILKLEN